jgi:hypothetical protein
MLRIGNGRGKVNGIALQGQTALSGAYGVIGNRVFKGRSGQTPMPSRVAGPDAGKVIAENVLAQQPVFLNLLGTGD